jgi:hypothetical protein
MTQVGREAKSFRRIRAKLVGKMQLKHPRARKGLLQELESEVYGLRLDKEGVVADPRRTMRQLRSSGERNYGCMFSIAQCNTLIGLWHYLLY